MIPNNMELICTRIKRLVRYKCIYYENEINFLLKLNLKLLFRLSSLMAPIQFAKCQHGDVVGPQFFQFSSLSL